MTPDLCNNCRVSVPTRSILSLYLYKMCALYMMALDPNTLRLPLNQGLSSQRVPGPPRHRRGHPFLKGPIEMSWLARAARQPGRALHVGIAVWYRVGLKKTRTIALNLSRMSDFGLDRFAARRGLAALERAGLVAVTRAAGRNPVITVLDASEEPDARRAPCTVESLQESQVVLDK